jgi:hypothetical protein
VTNLAVCRTAYAVAGGDVWHRCTFDMSNLRCFTVVLAGDQLRPGRALHSEMGAGVSQRASRAHSSAMADEWGAAGSVRGTAARGLSAPRQWHPVRQGRLRVNALLGDSGSHCWEWFLCKDLLVIEALQLTCWLTKAVRVQCDVSINAASHHPPICQSPNSVQNLRTGCCSASSRAAQDMQANTAQPAAATANASRLATTNRWQDFQASSLCTSAVRPAQNLLPKQPAAI